MLLIQSFLPAGNVGGLLFLFLTGWASIGSFGIYVHFNPFTSVTNFESDGIDFQLEQGRITCPKCMAILQLGLQCSVQVTDVLICSTLIDPNLAINATEEE